MTTAKREGYDKLAAAVQEASRKHTINVVERDLSAASWDAKVDATRKALREAEDTLFAYIEQMDGGSP